jgi:hypothetical protein
MGSAGSKKRILGTSQNPLITALLAVVGFIQEPMPQRLKSHEKWNQQQVANAKRQILVWAGSGFLPHSSELCIVGYWVAIRGHE